MKRPILLRLHDMLEAIETADEIIGTTTFAQFDRDRVKRFAVERCIEIVSEASRHIPETAKQDFPEIPWREIAAVGNLLRHDYRRIDNRILWRIATQSLAELKPVLIQLKARAA
jgi:uncharacterized protein with HEPN domain